MQSRVEHRFEIFLDEKTLSSCWATDDKKLLYISYNISNVLFLQSCSKEATN